MQECGETVKGVQDKIGVFMTAIMSRKKRVGREEGCEDRNSQEDPRQNRGLYDRYNVRKKKVGKEKESEDRNN